MEDNKNLIAEAQIGKIDLASPPVGGDISGDSRPKMKPTADIIPAKPAPVDTVALMYPRYASDIQAARSAGYGDEEISGYFGRLEAEAALYYSPMQIDRHFQRTEKSKAALSDYFTKSRIYGYYTARNGELSQIDIEERIATARKLGMKEAPLINDDKLYKEIKKIADEPSGDPWWDYINKHILETFKIRVGGGLSSALLGGTGVTMEIGRASCRERV